jgi:tRNA dimethylallyltransferase
MARPLVLAILGPTATGKSAMALALAERFGGEIVQCDSTAVYRGFDIVRDRFRTPIVFRSAPSDRYRRAHRRVPPRSMPAMRRPQFVPSTRGRLPILAEEPASTIGPSRADSFRAVATRACGAGWRHRRTPWRQFLHRLLHRVDAGSAARIQPRDVKRMVRALEVFFLTGLPLTEHFARTESPLPDVDRLGIVVRLDAAAISERVTRRVDRQFERGLLDEVRRLLARGIPESARPFGGLVYRQALEHLHGVRDETATRALISQENRRYARRQLIWFRKEPDLIWLDGPGESPR